MELKCFAIFMLILATNLKKTSICIKEVENTKKNIFSKELIYFIFNKTRYNPSK